MGWARLDDQFWNHAKVERLQREEGPATFAQAICLWTMALSWCCRRERDTVSLRQLRLMMPLNAKLTKATKALVRVELWHSAGPDEWRIHDFADYLPRPARAQLQTKSEQSLTKVRTKFDESPNEVRRKSDESLAKVRPLPPSESFGNQDTPDPDPDPELKESLLSTADGSRARAPEQQQPTLSSDGSEPFESASKLLEASGRFGTPSAAVASTLRRVWAECWGSRTAGQPPPRAALDAVSRQAGLVVAEAERLGVSPHEMAARSVTAFFAAKSGYRRPRVEWWTEDPLRWGGETLDAAAPPEPEPPARFIAFAMYRDGQECREWQDNETGATWWDGTRPPDESIDAFREFCRTFPRKPQVAAGAREGLGVAEGA